MNDTDTLIAAAERIGQSATLIKGVFRVPVTIKLPRITFGRLEYLVETPEGKTLWVSEKSLETPTQETP